MPQAALTNGDVLLVQTDDGGDFQKRAGFIEMTSGFETMAYLCMFGGNATDPGGSDKTFSWWGNLDEPEEVKHLRSETQYVLAGLPRTSGNLRKLEDAARRDLDIFLSENIASNVAVQASIYGRSGVEFLIDIEAFGLESRFRFVENWKSAE